MNIRQNTGIGRQISFLPVISLVGFAIILIIQYSGLRIQSTANHQVQEQMQALENIRHIQFEISKVRISEKNFLINQGLDSAMAHRAALDSIMANIANIKRDHLNTVTKKVVADWERRLSIYQDQFWDITKELTFIGYNETTGLRGTMRNAAHSIERRLGQTQPFMSLILLQMRRHEKDFLIRKKITYVDRWEKSLAIFREYARTSTLNVTNKMVIDEALNRYADAFRLIVEHTRDLQVDQSIVDDSSAALLQSINMTFENISVTAAADSEAADNNSMFIFSVVVAATIAIGVFALIFGRWIAAGICRPLTALGKSMERLADGNLEAGIPGQSYQNEIGEMAKSVRIFRQYAKERRRARRLLREANRQNQNIIQSMQEALFEVDAHGAIKMANPAAEHLLEAEAGGLIGKNIEEYFVNTVEAGKAADKLGRVKFSVETLQRNNPEKFRTLIKKNPLPLLLVNNKGVIVQFSDTAAAAFGYQSVEMAGLEILKLVPEKERERHARYLTDPSVIGAGLYMGNDATFVSQSKDGSYQDMVIGLLPLTLDGEAHIFCILRRKGVDASISDISETEFGRLFAGFDLDPSLARLVQADKKKGRIVHYMVTNSGAHVPVNYSSALLREDDNSVSGAICVVRDISENRKSEREISQYKSTLDRVVGEIYMFTPDSLKFIYVNEAAKSRIGKEMNEIVTLTPIDVTDGLVEAEFRARLQPLIDGTKVAVTYESVRVHDDGRVTPDDILIQLVEPEGQEPRFIAFVNNITERKAAETEILRFKSTLDAMTDTVFMFHPDTLHFTFLNQEALRQTGWNKDSYQTKTPADINPAFDEARFRALVKPLVFGTQKSVSLRTVGLNKKPIELTIEMFDPDTHDDSWFVVTTRDISDRLAAEKETRQFKKTLDLSQDEVYMFWPDSLKFIYQNQAARRLSGWTSTEYVQKTLMDNNENFDPDEFRKIAKPLIDGTEKQIIYEKTGKNDRLIEVSLQLIRPTDDKPRFVAITRDISERKAAEKAKAEFISTVSHELRTPLTSIKGALGIINTGAVGEMGDKLKSLVNIALTNSDRLVRLINDILDIEKFEAGKMEFRLEPMDMSRLIEESIAANEGYASTHKITFRPVGTDHAIMVNGDYGRLMQVMANLLSNAAKFSAEGAEIQVVAKAQDGKVRVSVIDTGSGIPTDAQVTIFDKFTQADSSDKRKRGGTGLGLSIVKMMVEAHGGKIDFVSKPGSGSTFFFDLDILPAQEDSIPSNREAAQGLKIPHLLVCEDDRDIATLLKLMLKNAGYHADIAATAGQAKEMLLNGNYDAMTLDLVLPDQNGLSLLRDLRAINKFVDLPVFIVSANIPPDHDGLDVTSLGVIDWIEKPIDEQKLIGLLRHTVDQRDIALPDILHVDDDDNILEIVREIIGDRANLFSATTAKAARQKLQQKQFDLVILDLNLPDGIGDDLLPYLNQPPQDGTPVLVFSAQDISRATSGIVEAALVKSQATNNDFLRMVQKTLKKRVAQTRTAAE